MLGINVDNMAIEDEIDRIPEIFQLFIYLLLPTLHCYVSVNFSLELTPARSLEGNAKKEGMQKQSKWKYIILTTSLKQRFI